MKNIDEAIQKTKELYEALKVEWHAAKAFNENESKETFDTMRAAQIALLAFIEMDPVAKALFLFGHRIGMAKHEELMRTEVESRLGARAKQEAN
jgi:predicted hydrocarbon binding protein